MKRKYNSGLSDSIAFFPQFQSIITSLEFANYADSLEESKYVNSDKIKEKLIMDLPKLKEIHIKEASEYLAMQRPRFLVGVCA